MPLTELRVVGYRSIPELTLALKRANVIVGPNGCGKSNLYRSVSLVRSAAEGTLARELAEEGGMPSVLWAGPRKEKPVRMRLGVTVDDYDYTLELGLPMTTSFFDDHEQRPSGSLFVLDPKVKHEELTFRQGRKKLSLIERGSASCTLMSDEGERVTYTLALDESESALSQISDPKRFGLIDDFRRRLSKWRFYHGFRTDAYSPIRMPRNGVRTSVLSSSGEDVAAALQTIRENGDAEGLREAVEDAFPGARILVGFDGSRLSLGMSVAGLNRDLGAHEMSDGTLRYLCLLAALLSPRPAPLLALNEPETSLHESLLKPLARLIAKTAESSQIWLTTHSSILADEVCTHLGVMPIALEKSGGATIRATNPI